MSSQVDYTHIDPTRIKIYKKIGNPNYTTEYYKSHKYQCSVCKQDISLSSKKYHIGSKYHILNMKNANITFESPYDCYKLIKITPEKKE